LVSITSLMLLQRLIGLPNMFEHVRSCTFSK